MDDASKGREAAAFRRLRWAAILAPVGLAGLLALLRRVAAAAAAWPELVTIGVAIAFYALLFRRLGAQRAVLHRHNSELEALREAGLDIAAELALEPVLGKIVEQARRLIGTRYGALAVISGKGEIETFVTSGVDETTRRRIGEPPRGRGLLGVSLRAGQRLRLADLEDDARRCGFPPEHPPMRSLLAVPITCRSPFRGNLYLSERHDGRAFTDDDEETLARFATQAAVAIDNADLHRRLRTLDLARERVRIAHELHDGQAQVLAYVNTKAQAVLEFLRGGRTEAAAAQLEELAAAARQVYSDVREDILGLRVAAETERGLGAALRDYVADWQDRHGLPVRLEIDELPRLPQDVELQLVRIVQEALSNVRKHAAASHVEVTLQADSRRLRLTVSDDGRGFEIKTFERRRIPRFGLATMRERAEAIGAHFEIVARPERGTRVELLYPAERGHDHPVGASAASASPVMSRRESPEEPAA